MELIAAIEDERVAAKILLHLGLPARAPPRGRPWGAQHVLPGVHDAPDGNGVDPPFVTD
jgi:hypothetical protein